MSDYSKHKNLKVFQRNRIHNRIHREVIIECNQYEASRSSARKSYLYSLSLTETRLFVSEHCNFVILFPNF